MRNLDNEGTMTDDDIERQLYQVMVDAMNAYRSHRLVYGMDNDQYDKLYADYDRAWDNWNNFRCGS